MRGVSTQPKLTVLPHAYRVLVCWCVGVLVCWCVGVLVCWCVGVLVYGCCMMLVCAGCPPSLSWQCCPMPTGCWCVGVWLLCDASMRGVSTQPKLTVLPHAYWALVCGCCVMLVCAGCPPSLSGQCYPCLLGIGVLVYGCCVMLVISMRGVSTQPKLTVLTHAYWVLACWCKVVER